MSNPPLNGLTNDSDVNDADESSAELGYDENEEDCDTEEDNDSDDSYVQDSSFESDDDSYDESFNELQFKEPKHCNNLGRRLTESIRTCSLIDNLFKKKNTLL